MFMAEFVYGVGTIKVKLNASEWMGVVLLVCLHMISSTGYGKLHDSNCHIQSDINMYLLIEQLNS